MRTKAWIRNLGATLLLCSLGSPAMAGGLEGAGPLVAKNMDMQAVQIDRDVYYVSPSTIMRDENGDLVSLAELDVPTKSTLDQSPKYADYDADFEAHEVGGKLVLQTLTVEPGEMN